jgi:hypothetical protein
MERRRFTFSVVSIWCFSTYPIGDWGLIVIRSRKLSWLGKIGTNRTCPATGRIYDFPDHCDFPDHPDFPGHRDYPGRHGLASWTDSSPGNTQGDRLAAQTARLSAFRNRNRSRSFLENRSADTPAVRLVHSSSPDDTLCSVSALNSHDPGRIPGLCL